MRLIRVGPQRSLVTLLLHGLLHGLLLYRRLLLHLRLLYRRLLYLRLLPAAVGGCCVKYGSAKPSRSVH